MKRRGKHSSVIADPALRIGSSSGSIMLEFVIAFPVVLVLMLACIQIAHLWTAKLVVHYAAYCAARAGLVTVCDMAEPDDNNDSWPKRAEMPVLPGLTSAYCLPDSAVNKERYGDVSGRPRSEAEYWGNKAAAQVCAWIVMGTSESTGETDINVPDWGAIPGSSAAERKTRAAVKQIGWNVKATVEHDFALIVPIVGPMLAWGMNPWDLSAATTPDETGNVHNNIDSVPYPHIRLTETVWLPKPYRTIIAADNWPKASFQVLPPMEVPDWVMPFNAHPEYRWWVEHY